MEETRGSLHNSGRPHTSPEPRGLGAALGMNPLFIAIVYGAAAAPIDWIADLDLVGLEGVQVSAREDDIEIRFTAPIPVVAAFLLIEQIAAGYRCEVRNE